MAESEIPTGVLQTILSLYFSPLFIRNILLSLNVDKRRNYPLRASLLQPPPHPPKLVELDPSNKALITKNHHISEP